MVLFGMKEERMAKKLYANCVKENLSVLNIFYIVPCSKNNVNVTYSVFLENNICFTLAVICSFIKHIVYAFQQMEE